METVQIKEFTVKGIKTRTQNSNEIDPATARIAGLWQEFFETLGKQGPLPARAYGVYTAYESDALGEFDLIAGIEEPYPGKEAVETTVRAGAYLKFERQGPCPATCIALWQEIWAYFQQPDAPERTYDTDFEAYEGAEKVAIHIGIKS